MTAVAFALLAAIGFAVAAVSSKKGLEHVSTIGGVVISLPAGLVVVAAIALFDLPDTVPLRSIPLLVVAGLLGSAVGRLLMIAGLRRLDSTVYVPMQTSTHPVVGVVGGFVLFNEPVSLIRAVGVAVIIVGIWTLTRGLSAAETTAGLDVVLERPTPPSRHSGLAVLFPVAAGLVYGGADVTTNLAMKILPYPAFGAMIGILASTVVWGTMLTASQFLRTQATFGPGKRWFVLQGGVGALAVLCVFMALRRGDVSMVSPIIATQPCWILLLSALLLRRIETVTRHAVLGSLLVTLGAALVGIS